MLIVAVVISLTTSLFLYFQIMQSAQKDLASVVSQVARQWQQQALRPGSSNTPHAERSDIHFQIVSRQENDNVVSHFGEVFGLQEVFESFLLIFRRCAVVNVVGARKAKEPSLL